MDRETRRIVESTARDEADRSRTTSSTSWSNGELDREEFLQRAPCSAWAPEDRRALALRRGGGRSPTTAATRGRQGRRHDPTRHRRTRELARAVPPERRRRARVRRHPGRVPDVHEPPGTGSPDAGDELEDEQGRNGLDVPAPQGRALPQRQGDDVRRRRRLDEAIRRQGIERRPRPLLRPGGRLGRGRYAVASG